MFDLIQKRSRQGFRAGSPRRRRRLGLDILERRATPSVDLGFALSLSGPGSEEVSSVEVDSLGNFYVAGSFNGTIDLDPGPKVFDLSNTGTNVADAFLAKYSSDGTLLWAGEIADVGPAGPMHHLGLAIGPNDSVSLSGGTPSTTTDFNFGSGVSTLSSQSFNGFIANYTTDGKFTWVQGLTSPSVALAVDTDGNLYSVQENSGFCKFDSAGNLLQEKQLSQRLPQRTDQRPWGIAVDGSKNVYITGKDPDAQTDSDQTYVLKLSGAGDVLYRVSLVGTVTTRGIAVDPEGDAYVAGDFSGDNLVVKGSDGSELGSLSLMTASPSNRLFTMRLDASGNLDWLEGLSGDQIENGFGITYAGTDSLYVTGAYTLDVDFDPGPGVATLTNAGGVDAFVLRLAPVDGSYVSAMSLGADGDTVGLDVAVTPGGDVYTVGRYAGATTVKPGDASFDLAYYPDGNGEGFVSKLTQGLQDPKPLSQDDTLSTDQDRPLLISTSDLVANDTDSNNDPLNALEMTGPEHGTLTRNADGSFAYRPDHGFFGTDSFTYVASDGTRNSDVASVTITVNPVADPDLSFAFDLDLNTSRNTFSKVATDGQGDVYVCGTFAGTVDFDPGPATYNLTAQAFRDLFLAKYAADGSLIWVDQFRSTSFPFSSINGIAVSTDGSICISGVYDSALNLDPGGDTRGFIASNARLFVAKYASDGTLDWATGFGGGTSSSIIPEGIALDESGNIYTTGIFSAGTLDLDPGAGTALVTNTSTDRLVYISELSSHGDYLWSGQLGTQPDAATWVESTSIQVDSNNNVYLTGFYMGTVDFDPGSGTLWKTSQTTLDMPADGYILKLQANHEVGYFVSMAGGFGTEETSVDVDSEGNAYVTGLYGGKLTIYGPDGNTAGTLTPSGFGQTGSVLKLDSSGHLVWAFGLDSTYFTRVKKVVLDGSTLQMVGSYSGSTDFDPGAGQWLLSTGDIGDFQGQKSQSPGSFLWQLSTDGSIISAEDLGLSSNSDIDLAIDNQGNAIVAGSFEYSKILQSNTTRLTLTTAAAANKAYLLRVNPERMLLTPSPTARDDSYSVQEDTTLSISVSSLLANDADPSHAPLLPFVTSLPKHGTLSRNTDGSLTYTPSANFSGTDTFTYQARAGWAYSAPATVNIVIEPVDDPPMGRGDSYVVLKGQTLSVDSKHGVLANDTDIDSNTLTAILESQPTYGTVTLNPDGSFTYTPEAFFSGSDSFTYQADDGQAVSARTTVFIVVNAPPLPLTQPVSAAPGESRSISVRANDATTTTILLYKITSIPALGTLTYQTNSGPAQVQVGQLFYDTPPLFTFTAGSDTGTDSLAFSVTDSYGASSDGEVAITVTTPPTPTTSDLLVAAGSSATFSFDATDRLTPKSQLRFMISYPPTSGNLYKEDGSIVPVDYGFIGTQTLTYKTAPGYSGSFALVYRVTNANELSSIGSMLITVNAPPVPETPPVVVPVAGSAEVDVKAEDSTTRSKLVYEITSLPSLGTLTYDDGSGPASVQVGQTFTDTPPAFTYTSLGTGGEDSLKYSVTDSYGTSANGEVPISVDEAPVPDSPSIQATAGQSAMVMLTGSDRRTNLTSLVFQITSLPQKGVLYTALTPVKVGDTFVGPASLTYRAGYRIGSDSIGFTISDSVNPPVPGQVTLSVKGSNAHQAGQQGDYDGDGKADIMVFRPDTATFFVSLSSGGGLIQQWGWAFHDQPLIGDYDGDGKTDFAVFRPETATFYAKLSSGGRLTQQWGWIGHDQAETGDYDGDGKTDIAVFRPDNATFYVKLSSGGSMTQQWGWAFHDQPLIGDYDGDGKTDFAVFRPQNGTFYVNMSTGGMLTRTMVNTNSPMPVTADYNGDGRTDFVVYQADTAVFNVLLLAKEGSYPEASFTRQYGWAGHDLPISGDYDGDGITDYGVFRPDDSTFYIKKSFGGFLTQQWGWVGHDEPVELPAYWYSIADSPATNGSANQSVSVQSVSTRLKVQNMLDRYGLDGRLSGNGRRVRQAADLDHHPGRFGAGGGGGANVFTRGLRYRSGRDGEEGAVDAGLFGQPVPDGSGAFEAEFRAGRWGVGIGDGHHALGTATGWAENAEGEAALGVGLESAGQVVQEGLGGGGKLGGSESEQAVGGQGHRAQVAVDPATGVFPGKLVEPIEQGRGGRSEGRGADLALDGVELGGEGIALVLVLGDAAFQSLHGLLLGLQQASGFDRPLGHVLVFLAQADGDVVELLGLGLKRLHASAAILQATCRVRRSIRRGRREPAKEQESGKPEGP